MSETESSFLDRADDPADEVAALLQAGNRRVEIIFHAIQVLAISEIDALVGAPTAVNKLHQHEHVRLFRRFDQRDIICQLGAQRGNADDHRIETERMILREHGRGPHNSRRTSGASACHR